MSVTPTQARVLCFLDTRVGMRWCQLLEIDCTKLLQEDDVVVVPSLIECGLVKYASSNRSVALTIEGVIVAKEIRAERERNVVAKRRPHPI